MINDIAFKYNRSIKNTSIRDILQKFYYLSINFKKFLAYGTTDMFDEVVLETTSLCNRKCSYCPVSKYQRPKAKMEEGLHNKILEGITRMNFSGQLTYQFYSEPLLDSRLEEFIASARKKLPKNEISIYTNGDLLTERRVDSLINSGISRIYVTLHEKKNLSGFLRMYKNLGKKERKVIAVRELNEDSVLLPRGGLVEVKNKEVKKYCGYPSNSLTIDVSGKIVLCCEDYFGKYSFGDVNKSTIRQIWDNERFRRIRVDSFNGKFTLPICSNCTQREI